MSCPISSISPILSGRTVLCVKVEQQKNIATASISKLQLSEAEILIKVLLPDSPRGPLLKFGSPMDGNAMTRRLSLRGNIEFLRGVFRKAPSG